MESFPRHDEGNTSEWPAKKKPKKRKYDEIKTSKVLGREHINHVGKHVEARKTGNDCRYS